MFSIRKSIGGWYDGNGKKHNDAQAAGILFREAESFLNAVKAQLGLCQCARCGKWGKLEGEIFILRAGDKPTCADMDCICNKFSGEDYTSDTIISVALLGSCYRIKEPAFHAVCNIEPTILEVWKFMRGQEIPFEYYKADKKSIRRMFKAEFDEIDACATEPTTPVEVTP